MSLVGALGLGGCLFLTPPTGLRLGDHTNEYPPSAGAGAEALRRYTAPDFEILVPERWPARPIIDVLNPQGSIAQRVAYGISFSDAPGDEGLIVSTVLVPGLKDADLFQAARDVAKSAVLAPVVSFDEAASVGPVLGHRIEVAGADPRASAEVNLMVAAASHKGFGYLIVLRTIRLRHQAFRPIFLGMLERFAFLDGPLPPFDTIGQPHPELDATQTAAVKDAIASAQVEAALAAAQAAAAASASAAPAGDRPGSATPANPSGDRPATAGI